MIKLAVAVSAFVCLATAGCGSANHSDASRVPAPKRVCTRAAQAADKALGPAKVGIADSDPADIECRLQGTGVSLYVVALAATQAWTEYDTFVVHQVQAYSGGGPSTRSQLPQDVSISGAQAAWVPAQHELVATNGTESSGGSYVTVSVKRASSRGREDEAVARSVAAAVLAVAPRGPSPGPPPS